MGTEGLGIGIPSDRVVAVLASLDTGQVQIGSGYLVTEGLVLTARHCAVDKKTNRPAWKLTVARRSGGPEVAAMLHAASPGLDVAVLAVKDLPWTVPVTSGEPRFGRVDRSRTAELRDCEAVGFPLWQVDPQDRGRNAAELHGTIRVTEDLESGLLVMRDPLLIDVTAPSPGNAANDQTAEPPWGGLSGALVFCEGLAVGVVIEHHRRQGGSAIRIVPMDRLYASLADGGDRGAAAVVAALQLPSPDKLPVLGEQQSGAGSRPFQGSRLESYLEAARDAARQQLHTFHFADEPLLSAVYVPQQVSPHAPHTQAGPTSVGYGIRRPDVLDAPAITGKRAALTDAAALVQKLDVWDVLRRYPSVLITGGPGTGKSSLLRYVVETLANGWLAGSSESFVPILVQAEALTMDMPFPDALANSVTGQLGTTLDDPNLRTLFVEQPMPDKPWLILVDGIDEILDIERRRKAFNSVVRWSGNLRYRFLLASRMLPLAEFRRLDDAGVKRFEIQVLTEEQSILLARRWFVTLGVSGADVYIKRFRVALRRGRLGQLARNPLIATAICVGLVDDLDRELPLSRADLYESLVDSLIERPIASSTVRERLHSLTPDFSGEPRLAIDRVLRDLRPLTEFLAESRRFQIASRTLLNYAQEYPSCRLPAHLGNSVWRDILAEILRRNGCLVQQGKDFTFIHYTVMEYLAACSGIRHLSRPRGMRKLELKIRAGQGDTYALFVVSVLHRNNINLTRPVPKVLGIRRLIHARLVAALDNEGINLEPKLVDLARRRLEKEAARPQQHRLARLRGSVWQGEDERVAAAKSLETLIPGGGHAALAEAAIKPDVENFNIYDFLAQYTIRNPATDADLSRSLDTLADLAVNPSLDSFQRMLLIEPILELDPERGVQVTEKMARDPSLDSPDRKECIARLLEANVERGIATLVALCGEPLADLTLRFQAVGFLRLISPVLARDALDRIALDSANTGFARYVASVKISRERPADRKTAILALSTDKEAPDFPRVASAMLLDSLEMSEQLVKLSTDPSMAGKWRLYAAECLAAHDMGKAIATMHEIARDPGNRWRLRLQALLYRWILQVFGRLKADRGLTEV
jgi:hypothetical protein